MRSISRILLAAGALGAFAACERTAPPAKEPPPATSAVVDRDVQPPATVATGPQGVASPPHPLEVSRADVERLQALGYVDVTDEPVDGRSGVVVHDRKRSSPGYNVFTNAHLCSTQLVDADGTVLRTWALEPCFRWDNTSLLPDGDLLVVGRAQKPDRRDGDGDVHGDDRGDADGDDRGRADGDGRGDTHGGGDHDGARGWAAGRYVARLGWNGEVRWKVPLGAHHDAQLNPRGEIAVLTASRRLVPELDARRKLKDDALTLLSAETGTVLASASLHDLLKTAPEDQFRFQTRTRGKGHLDLLHANSVAWMQDAQLAARDPLYATSNVVVTIRHQDTVAIVDWDAKKVVWAWGQGELSGPHDAVILPSGNLLVFDNGLGRGWSRVLEIDPRSRTIVWQYRAPDPKSFYTQTRGANQRLPNGNTLIAQSDSGRAFEVTPDGTIVWEFFNPNLSDGKRGGLVRMRRIEPEVVAAWRRRDDGAAGATPAAAH